MSVVFRISDIFKVIFLGLVAQQMAFGQATWIGADGANWDVETNWSGIAPTSNGNTSLIFNSATNRTSVNGLSSFTANGISVTGGADNTLNGNAITLAGNISVNTGNWQTFNLNMALGSGVDRSVSVSTGRLYLNGVLSGGAAFVKSGGGELYLNGINSITGNGTSTVLSAIPGGGTYNRALEFSGATSGSVYLTNTAALGTSSNLVRFSGGGSGSLVLQTNTSVNAYTIFSGSGNGGTIVSDRATAGAGITHNLGVLDLSSVVMNINAGSNVTSGTAGVSFTSLSMSGGNDNGPVTLAGNAAISIGTAGITNNTNISRRLQLDGTNSGNTIGVISNLAPNAASNTGIVSLIKANTSTWTLTGANTFTGTTTITGGTLQLGNGGTTGALSTSSAISNNAVLAINRSNTVTQGTDFASTISGSGSLLKAGSGNLILTGSNLGTGTSREVLTLSGSNAGTVTLSNSAALGAAGNTVRFSGGGSGVVDLQTNTSVNSFNISSGTGNGGTLIINRETTGAGVTHALGVLDLSSVTLTSNTGSNVTSGTAGVSFTELRMTGGNDNNPVTLAGSATYSVGSASITANGFSKRLQLDGSSLGNTIGAISNSSNSTAGAVVNLIKAGSSTWTLTDNNTYSGTTSISSGTLRLGNGGSTGNLAGTSNITNNGTLAVNHSNAFTQATDLNNRAISGTGSLIQSGTGTTVLTAANTYSGGTSVLSGTLTVNNTTGSGTGTGAVTVSNGATLNGSGTLGGVVTFQNGAQHNPGNSPGIQTFSAGAIYSSGSIFNWELSKNTDLLSDRGLSGYDGVNITGGTLTIQSGAISNLKFNSNSSVNWSDSFWNTSRRWLVFDNTGSQQGTAGIFTTINVSPDSTGQTLLASRGVFSWVEDTNDLYLQYTAVPEPTTLISCSVVVATMLYYRRRRKSNKTKSNHSIV